MTYRSMLSGTLAKYSSLRGGAGTTWRCHSCLVATHQAAGFLRLHTLRWHGSLTAFLMVCRVMSPCIRALQNARVHAKSRPQSKDPPQPRTASRLSTPAAPSRKTIFFRGQSAKQRQNARPRPPPPPPEADALGRCARSEALPVHAALAGSAAAHAAAAGGQGQEEDPADERVDLRPGRQHGTACSAQHWCSAQHGGQRAGHAMLLFS